MKTLLKLRLNMFYYSLSVKKSTIFFKCLEHWSKIPKGNGEMSDIKHFHNMWFRLFVGLTPTSSAGKQRLISWHRDLPPVLLYRFVNDHLISIKVGNW